MAKLSLRHVSKRYPNGFWAVKDFNLEMEDGEFVILTGSPKCGKSTVLRMIAGKMIYQSPRWGAIVRTAPRVTLIDVSIPAMGGNSSYCSKQEKRNNINPRNGGQ